MTMSSETKHPLETIQPKPRTTPARLAQEFKIRLERVRVAFDQPGQDGFLAGIDYARGVLDTLLDDYDTREPGDVAAARRSQPAPEAVPVVEREPDWSRFVPTEEIPESALLKSLKPNDIVASTLVGVGARVVRLFPGGFHFNVEVLASDEKGDPGNRWNSSHARLIRHADGRWADGYNPEGPCMPKCGTRDDEGGAWREPGVAGGPLYCTPFCRDRAKAKAGEPKGLYRKFTVERTDGSSGPGGKHEHCDYFVLDWTHDKFAVPAAMAYARACEGEYPGLARDLRDRAGMAVASSSPPRTEPIVRAPVTSAAVQGEHPLSEWMRADREELKRALVTPGADGRSHSPPPGALGILTRFLAHAEEVSALEAANAELRDQAVRWEQQIQDSGVAHERQVTELRADNDRLSREVVRLGSLVDALERAIRSDEPFRGAPELRAQLGEARTRIAGLESSAADLVRRAQEAEAMARATGGQAVAAFEAAAREFEGRMDRALAVVAELRGKLAAAEQPIIQRATLAERERCTAWAKLMLYSSYQDQRIRQFNALESGAPAPEVG